MPLMNETLFTTLTVGLLCSVYGLPGMLVLISLEESSRFCPHMQRHPWFTCWWALWAWPLTALFIYLRGRHGHER